MILAMSLSKMGMPGLRTGLVVASTEVIERLPCINAVSALSPNAIGTYVLEQPICPGIMRQIAEDLIALFYRERYEWIFAAMKERLYGYPVRLYESSGTMLLWLGLENAPMSSQELCRIKKVYASRRTASSR